MEFRQVLAPDGSAVGPLPDLDDKDLLELYRSMVWSRIADRRALAAQRLGRLGTYPMLEGHEAAQVGSAAAFAPHDFIYPAYREMGVQITRGMPLEVILAYWRGMPNEAWNPYEYHMMSIAVPIASQLPHAVGHAYQTRREGRDVVTGTYIGDGGTSEGDFHAALNFAGVWRTPTVFICQNNFYAISVPYEKQTAAESIAAKAGAYGMPGVRVDGMDVLAVYAATREAVERAGMATEDYGWEELPGEGAFYAPKLEFHLTDAIGRTWQCGTIQSDRVMPERLDASYIGEDGERHRPVMLHRAILGTYERFIGILIEHFAGRFPTWLAPVQVVVATIVSDADDFAKDAVAQLTAAGIRVESDLRNEKINYKVREHSLAKVPYLLVVGKREADEGTVAIRTLGQDGQRIMPLVEAIAMLKGEATPPDLRG